MLVIQGVVKPGHVLVAIFLLTSVGNGPIPKLEEKRVNARYLLCSPVRLPCNPEMIARCIFCRES